MSTLVHADIFFFISSIGVVLITIVFIISGICIALAAHEVRTLAQRINHEIDTAKEEIEAFRTEILSPLKLLRKLSSVFWQD